MVKLEERTEHIAPKSIVLLEMPDNESPVPIIAGFLKLGQDVKGSTFPQVGR